MKSSAFLAILLFAACGDDIKGGATDATHVDAPKVIPAMVTVSGTAIDPLKPTADKTLAGVTVTANKVSDDSEVATATTGADGTYTLTITTNGVAVDAYVKTTLATYLDTYLYPPAPLDGDFPTADINMLLPASAGALYMAAGVTPDPAAGSVSMKLIDDTGAPVQAATITTDPASTYRYGIPPISPVHTDAGGIASALNAPVGAMTVNAMVDGGTFKSHTIKVRAGVFTTTLITE